MSQVLVIEDDSLIALDLAGILQDMGHRVLGPAGRQSQAVAMAEEGRPDLILADVRLADGGDGIAAVKQIRRSRSVPVIFITGNARQVALDLSLEPAAVIPKPFDTRQLRRAVNAALSAAA